MPFESIKLRPGIRGDLTSTLNEGGWSSGRGIRWREGLPEKRGGFEKYWPFSIGSSVVAIHAWEDLNATGRLASGATSQLGVIASGDLLDITPQTMTSNFTPDFTTTSGSPTVVIDDPNIADVTTYDSVYFNTPVSVGGVVLSGLYVIDQVTGATSYEITAGADATASVSSAGAVPVFDTTLGSSTVTVTLADHGVVVGGKITFPLSTTVGGITIFGTYTVVSVGSVDVFTVVADAVATSTTTASMNAGSAQIDYYINIGPTAAGAGYGLGTYGTGGYGTGVVPPQQTGTAITATGWSLDNWGKTLLATPENGGLYAWDPDGGFQNAQLVATSNAPIFNTGMFVAQPARILVAYGSTTQKVSGSIGVYQDPMLVRWSDQDDYTNWSINTTDQVGSLRLPRGSAIISGLQGPNQALLWTDLGVWSMMYVGQPLVFSFNELASGCGIVAKHARAALHGIVYWMSQGNFYMLSGSGVTILPCTVWDEVFQDLDTDNQGKCWAWANSLFNEITFFYPSIRDGTGECSRRATFNVVDQVWDADTMARSSGIDQSVLGPPIAGTSSGIIYQHETSVDADGAPLATSLVSGDFMISEGTWCAFVDRLRPNMKWRTASGSVDATMQWTLSVYNDITGAVTTLGPVSYTSSMSELVLRARGHRMRVTISSNEAGTWWRLGNMRYRATADGRV